MELSVKPLSTLSSVYAWKKQLPCCPFHPMRILLKLFTDVALRIFQSSQGTSGLTLKNHPPSSEKRKIVISGRFPDDNFQLDFMFLAWEGLLYRLVLNLLKKRYLRKVFVMSMNIKENSLFRITELVKTSSVSSYNYSPSTF